MDGRKGNGQDNYLFFSTVQVISRAANQLSTSTMNAIIFIAMVLCVAPALSAWVGQTEIVQTRTAPQDTVVGIFQLDPECDEYDGYDTETTKYSQTLCNKVCGRFACSLDADVYSATLTRWTDQRDLFLRKSEGQKKLICRCRVEL